MKHKVKYKSCAKLEERMKFGTKMQLGIDNSNQLGAMQKSIDRTNPGDFRFSFLCSLCTEEKVYKFQFEFIAFSFTSMCIM